MKNDICNCSIGIKTYMILTHINRSNNTWLVVGTADSSWGVDDALLCKICTGLLMNWTLGSVDGMLLICIDWLVADVTGRRSPASCWLGTVTVVETPTDKDCDDKTHSQNSANTLKLGWWMAHTCIVYNQLLSSTGYVVLKQLSLSRECGYFAQRKRSDKNQGHLLNVSHCESR